MIITLNLPKTLKTFRLYYIVILPVIAGLLILAYFLFLKKAHETGPDNQNVTFLNDTLKNTDIKVKSDKEIDSILSQFGIKQSWITTKYPNDKQRIKDKKLEDGLKGSWFGKYVMMPTELNSIEVNFELTNYARLHNLNINVHEDISTKDLNIGFYAASDSSMSTPLIKLILKHDDKVKRENNYYSLIISNAADYKKEEIEELIKNEIIFSYLIPYSLDNFDIINKLNHEKKEVILELSAGAKDNYETDFHAGMDEKDTRQKVKSIINDFRNTKYVILRKYDISQFDDKLIRTEFEKNSIRYLSDSSVTGLTGDNSTMVIQKLLSKTSGIMLINLQYNELSQLRDGLNVLKKKGYKFFPVTQFMEYISRIEQKKLAELEKQKLNEKKEQIKKEQPKKELKKEQLKKDLKKNDTRSDKKKTKK